MEFRSKAKPLAGIALGGLLLIGASPGAVLAQHDSYDVRHRHWHGGRQGTLRVSNDGISYVEPGKKTQTDSREWRYEEIQQLTVSPTELHILTYEDKKWELGRDREYVFDRLPQDLAKKAYPLWASKMDRRFVAAVPTREPGTEWNTTAKLAHGLAGSMGSLTIGKDWIMFDSQKRGESRTWRLMDVENISQTGPLDLTVTTSEKSGWFRGGMRQFNFQLQQGLPEEIYNALWREINRSQGLAFLESQRAGNR